MSDYSTRNVIDYAMDDDGTKFREALYASIHDKVTNHIAAAKQTIAQNLITPQQEISQETPVEES